MDRVFRLRRHSCNSVCRDRRIADFAPIDISWMSRVIDGLGALKDKLTPFDYWNSPFGWFSFSLGHHTCVGFLNITTYPRRDIISAAIGDVTRSRSLCEVMDGWAVTNTESTCAADVTNQTESVHFKHLEAPGLCSPLCSGRNVYHRIARAEIACVIEALASLFPTDYLHRGRQRNLPKANTMRAGNCRSMTPSIA